MKTMIKLFLAGVVFAGVLTPAQAEDKPTIEILSSWTSGGEAAALNVFKTEFEKRGGVWKDSSIAGFGAADGRCVSWNLRARTKKETRLNIGIAVETSRG